MTDKERPVEINISGIPVAGVGGLGLVAIAALMTYQMPQAWLFVAAGAMGGVVVGAGPDSLASWPETLRSERQ